MSATITRLFDQWHDADLAVRDLGAAGVDHDDISVTSRDPDRTDQHAALADKEPGIDDDGDVSRGATAGAAIGGIGGLLAGLGLMAIPGLGPVVAAGWLAAAATGAGLGAAGGAAAGGMVGALKAAGHSDDEIHVYSEGLRRGGTLVSVKADEAHAAEIRGILERNHGVDAETRGADYRTRGWNGYDGDSPAYDRVEVETERTINRSSGVV